MTLCSLLLKKDWMGGYSVVDTNTADQDQTFDKMYPDATIKPTEAIAVLAANEDKLGLDDSITKKVFEFDKITLDNFEHPENISFIAVTSEASKFDKLISNIFFEF